MIAFLEEPGLIKPAIPIPVMVARSGARLVVVISVMKLRMVIRTFVNLVRFQRNGTKVMAMPSMRKKLVCFMPCTSVLIFPYVKIISMAAGRTTNPVSAKMRCPGMTVHWNIVYRYIIRKIILAIIIILNHSKGFSVLEQYRLKAKNRARFNMISLKKQLAEYLESMLKAIEMAPVIP